MTHEEEVVGSEADGVSSVDRRTWIRRLAAASGFAAPVVASFTMDGLAVGSGRAGAAAEVPSPWVYTGSFRTSSGGASYAWLPRGSYLSQDTGAPTDPSWEALLDPGATGVLVEFTVLPNGMGTGVRYYLAVDGAQVDTDVPGPGRFTKEITFATPTTAPVGVEITFATLLLPAVAIDDVVVRGIYG